VLSEGQCDLQGVPDWLHLVRHCRCMSANCLQLLSVPVQVQGGEESGGAAQGRAPGSCPARHHVQVSRCAGCLGLCCALCCLSCASGQFRVHAQVLVHSPVGSVPHAPAVAPTRNPCAGGSAPLHCFLRGSPLLYVPCVEPDVAEECLPLAELAPSQVCAHMPCCPHSRRALPSRPLSAVVRPSSASVDASPAVSNGVTTDAGAVPQPVVKIDNQHDPFATIVTVEFGDRLGELLDTVRCWGRSSAVGR